MIEIPYQQLSPEALQGVLEEFVSRDGTEFTSVSRKAAEARMALEQGRLKLIWDPDSETCQLVPAD